MENFNPKPLIDCEDEEYFAEESREITLDSKKK